ncbi:5,6-dimethylbenzimidazole synthase [Litorivita pollutaquae]|nr:5,6-dimethylbenzimidazole synthase [Litorivita pollutaquae]
MKPVISTFPDSFRQQFDQLMWLRRDVRRFRSDPIDEAALARALRGFAAAPSVGLSQPWRIIRLETADARAKSLANFEAANAQALAGYSGEKSKIYAGLKLSGMRDAPVQFAVFCDDSTPKGAGLGAATMPEMRRYSVVTAVTQFWLAARAEGLGVGWVSILDPAQLCADLDVPEDYTLVAYLCVGTPEEFTDSPELERAGWETRCTDVPVESR